MNHRNRESRPHGEDKLVDRSQVPKGFANIDQRADARPGVKLGPGVSIRKHAALRKGAIVRGGATIYPGARIEEYADVGVGARIGAGAIVGHGARIGASVWITGKALLPTIVEEHADIGRGCWLMGGNIKVGAKAHIGGGTCIREFVTIGENVRIGHGVTISPGVWINENTVVDDNVWIGKDTRIEPGACIGRGTRIKRASCIAPGVVIGEDQDISGRVGFDGLQPRPDPPKLNRLTEKHGLVAVKSIRSGFARVHGREGLDDHVFVGRDVNIENGTTIASYVWICKVDLPRFDGRFSCVG